MRRWLLSTGVGVLGAAFGAACGGTIEDAGVAPSRPSTIGAGTTDESGPGARCQEGTDPAIFAYDLQTGQDRWATCGDGDVQRFVRAATDELAYVIEQPVTGRGMMAEPPQLVAVDAGDGTERWRVRIASSWAVPSGPLIGGGIIVVPLDDGVPAIVGLDALDGEVVWRIDADERTTAVAVTDTVVVVRDDTIVDPGPRSVETDDRGQIVPPAFTFQLRGYDRLTGMPLWSTEVERAPNDPGMLGAAVADDTVVLLPGPFSVNATDGQIGWHAVEDGDPLPVGAVADGVVLTGTLDQPTTALDLATGDELWTRPGSAPYAGAFAVGDGAVYLNDRTDLIAYDLPTGAERWRQPNVPEDYSWPWHVADGTLFTMWWNLEARSTDDGSVTWHTNYPNGDLPTGPTPRMISIATSATTVIVTLYSGTLGGD